MPDDQEVDPELGTADEKLLKRIRQRYTYGMEKWRRNREDGQKNVRYVSGDPWDDADKAARAGRPTVCADQLNQYVNQVVNTARQNPIGIKVDPAGDQATDKLAEYRENRIRAIEYACNASQAYINGLQAAVERNVGYWKVSRAFVADDSDEQEIVILPIMNPDSVLIDPDFKELDGSDIRWAYELDRIPIDEFTLDYPDAHKTSFAAEDFGDDCAYWYDGKSILIASYWEIKLESATSKSGKRKVQSRKVQQYVTNGVEILHKGDVQPGPYIPIIPVFGKELWVDYGSGAERTLLSLVSLARDAQKALAFVMSSMLENMGQLPKTTYVGYVGQFETDKEAWDTINTQFHPYVQADPITDQTGTQTLPPPQRTVLTPDFNAYATGVDICQRAIMSAMGLQALPTVAQRQNQKSGVALDKIQSSQAVGSYHLIDSYNRAVKLTGRIVNGWLAVTDLGETQRPVREADGSHKLVNINTDEPVTDEATGHTYHFPIADDQGRYQVTISTGPSTDSQRQEASEFSDTIVQNLKNIPVPPQMQAQILASVIRMKQLGPEGDQLADMISPQQGNPQAQLQQLQQQGQQAQQQMQEMQAMLQKLMMEKQGKVIEMQGKAEEQARDHVFEASEADKDRLLKLTIAEADAKAQNESQRNETYMEAQQALHESAHDLALQQQAHQNALDMSQQQHAQGLEQQDAAASNASAQSAQDAEQVQQQQAAAPASGDGE